MNLSCDYLRNRKHRVVLNEQVLTWTNLNAGAPQGLIVGLLPFFIYRDYLADELLSNSRLIADDTSLFSVVHKIDSSAAKLNYDLAKTRHWTHHWKMSFNPDPSKQAQEDIFIRKVSKGSHPLLTFNSNIVCKATSQKHLGIIPDYRLSFEEHLRLVFSKVNITISLLCKLQCLVPRCALLTVCKTFVRPHLDYDGIIYEKNLKFIISKETLYDELGPFKSPAGSESYTTYTNFTVFVNLLSICSD